MPNAMHSLDSNSSTVPAFLVKLWKLVEDPTCDYLIAWNASGLSFIIKDQTTFAKDLLPQYFKHSNMASFIRQLNMYGFKKVLNIEKSGLKNDNNEMEFHHGCFRKGRSELLELIKRKISNPKTITETPVVKTNAKDILIDLTSIREKQENMDGMLLKMKSENELLWRELTTMRQKHKAQEQIIQKVIQFLVSIVQRNNPNIGVQRKINRMLHNSPSSKANSSQVSRTIDVLRKKNSDCIIVPEQIVSPPGPVIHEVLDGEHDENSPLAASQNSSVPSPCVKSPESVNEDAIPKYHLVSLLNNPSEPFSILEALTPKAPAVDAENEESESILGLPLEYITMPADTEVANVISIPDTDNVISIPEDVAINNVISIPEGHPINCNPILENNSIDTINQEESIKTSASENILNDKLASANTPHEFLSDIVSFGNLQPSTSQDLIEYSGDFHDDLSESLQTPKVHTTDEDPYIAVEKDSKQNNKSAKKSQVNSNSTYNEQDYQVATTESSSLAKNVLSNHVLTVDEKLNFTQDRLASSPWNFDVQKLLGLFSTDELVNCDAFNNQMSQISQDELNIKTEPNDIIGNELVQFSSPYGCELLDNNSQLFEALAENAEVSNEGLNYQPGSLLDEVLKEAAASEAADFLCNEVQLNQSPNKRRKTASKTTSKGKRRKVT